LKFLFINISEAELFDPGSLSTPIFTKIIDFAPSKNQDKAKILIGREGFYLSSL